MAKSANPVVWNNLEEIECFIPISILYSWTNIKIPKLRYFYLIIDDDDCELDFGFEPWSSVRMLSISGGRNEITNELLAKLFEIFPMVTTLKLYSDYFKLDAFNLVQLLGILRYLEVECINLPDIDYFFNQLTQLLFLTKLLFSQESVEFYKAKWRKHVMFKNLIFSEISNVEDIIKKYFAK